MPPPTVLLRESYRDRKKWESERWPICRACHRSKFLGSAPFCVVINCAQSPKPLRFALHAPTVTSKPCRKRDLVLAMATSRIIAPAIKLATTRLWYCSTLAQDFCVVDATEDDLYGAIDWFLAGQERLEQAWQEYIDSKT